MTEQNLSTGGSEERVRNVLAHHESQTEAEQLAEIEVAPAADGITLMAILIAQKRITAGRIGK